MAIQISNALKAKLPEAERQSVEAALWDKSGGICWLCSEPMNQSADDIHPDHEVPESEGGETTLNNLNLAHAACNKAKRNAKSVDIRPYLRLVAYAKKHGGRLKYDGYLDHFGIKPVPVVVHRAGDNATFELPDGSTATAPVYHETNKTGTHEYTFIPLPRSAIFNDDACQPRVVRTDHAWSIFSDMQRNVLHEPPSCRMESQSYDKPVKLLLFDGQHKTIASWMMGREVVTAKVYLNMSTARANELVNSIQAKIKKLPLSPFELASKMADEWQNKFGEYEAAVGATEVSEYGFIEWVPQTERSRAKSALQSALLQNVLSSPDLRLSAHVKTSGSAAQPFGFTEQQLKSKVLERLLVKEPLKAKGEDAQRVRDAEVANIVTVLNMLNDAAFEHNADDQDFLPVEKERARRMSYQASLAYVANLIRLAWNHNFLSPDPKQPMSQDLTPEQEAKMDEAVKRLVNHPVWTAAFSRDDRMSAVKAAMEKNQEAVPAFEAVALDLSYVILGPSTPQYKAYWK